MSRMTRQQWQDRITSYTRLGRSVGDLVSRIKRQMKRHLIRDGKIQDPATARPRFEWHWCTPEGSVGGSVSANTKGEARALVKKELGIKKNRRLPKVNFSKRMLLRENPLSVS